MDRCIKKLSGGLSMLETDEEGQRQMDFLIHEKDSGIFSEWERQFIQELIRRKKYTSLSKREKSIVTRLMDWHRGS